MSKQTFEHWRPLPENERVDYLVELLNKGCAPRYSDIGEKPDPKAMMPNGKLFRDCTPDELMELAYFGTSLVTAYKAFAGEIDRRACHYGHQAVVVTAKEMGLDKQTKKAAKAAASS